MMYNMNTNSSTDNTATKISIKKKYDDHYSYYVDANGLLKGEWGGYEELETKGPNGEAMYELYYTRTFKDEQSALPMAHCKWIVVNEHGYFYNKFSCKKYDAVEDIGSGYYRCEKNDRYGIINDDEQVILHTCYNQIWKSSSHPIFFVQCETGWFIYNVDQQRQSKVYEEIAALDSNYIRFSDGNGYGLMNYNCDIVIQPKFEKRTALFDDKNQLQIDFKGVKFGVFIKDDLFYGKISPNEYDYCFKVKPYDEFGTDYYITKKGEKYGILNYRFDCVIKPQLDDILIVKTHGRHANTLSRCFIIGKQGDLYKLFNSEEKSCIIEGCDSMDYCVTTKLDSNLKNYKRGFHYTFIEYCKDGHIGYVAYNGKIIGYDEYDSVELFHGFFLVSKNSLYGLLSESGNLIVPCENDEIKLQWGVVTMTKEGKETITNVRDLLSLPKDGYTYLGYEPQHYSEYAGSYAQDEMGYSDEDIDTIFDGDPSAYWNID